MRPIRHLLCGLSLAAGEYMITGDRDSSVACTAGAVLCDTDHIIEYAKYCHKYKVKPDFEEWNSGEYFTKKGTVEVCFHSWEICFLLWILIFILRYRSDSRIFHILEGLNIGYTAHLLMDQIGNNVGPFAYFLTHRWIHGFKQRSLEKE